MKRRVIAAVLLATIVIALGIGITIWRAKPSLVVDGANYVQIMRSDGPIKLKSMPEGSKQLKDDGGQEIVRKGVPASAAVYEDARDDAFLYVQDGDQITVFGRSEDGSDGELIDTGYFVQE